MDIERLSQQVDFGRLADRGRGCTRPRRDGERCRRFPVAWPSSQGENPVSCAGHLTDAEREGLAAARAADPFAALLMGSDPACWSWPVPTEVHTYVADLDATTDPAGKEGAASALLATWHQGRCAICGATERTVTDHDHQTGLVRGHICRSCNTIEAVQQGGVFARYRARPPVEILGLQIRYYDVFHREYAEPAAPPEDRWTDNPLTGIGL